MDGTYTGTLDRVVDGVAVVLVEDDGEVCEQLTVPVDELPDAPSGGQLSLTLSDGELVSVRYDPEATRDREQSARERLDRLSRRLSEREDR